jgi:hypothetical protein
VHTTSRKTESKQATAWWVIFKAKLGQAPSEKEDTIDNDGQQILANLRRSHKLLTDGVASFPRQSKFKGDEVISDYTELCLVDNYLELETQEKNHFKRLGTYSRVPCLLRVS